MELKRLIKEKFVHTALHLIFWAVIVAIIILLTLEKGIINIFGSPFLYIYI